MMQIVYEKIIQSMEDPKVLMSMAIGVAALVLVGVALFAMSVIHQSVFVGFRHVTEGLREKLSDWVMLVGARLNRRVKSVSTGGKKTGLFSKFLILFWDMCRVFTGTSNVDPTVIFVLVILASIGLGIIVGLLLGGGLFIPITIVVSFVAIVSFLYLRYADIKRKRILDVITSITTVCGNIRGGMLAAVEESFRSLPTSTKIAYQDFLDNVHNNMPMSDALEALEAALGEDSIDFISKVKDFEYGEERGMVDIFNDVVKANNLKLRTHSRLEASFKKAKFDFRISICAIFGLLIGVLIIFGDVRNWYFTSSFGAWLLLLDFIDLMIEALFMARLRSTAVN